MGQIVPPANVQTVEQLMTYLGTLVSVDTATAVGNVNNALGKLNTAIAFFHTSVANIPALAADAEYIEGAGQLSEAITILEVVIAAF